MKSISFLLILLFASLSLEATVGFQYGVSSSPETAGTITLDVSMDVAPVSDVLLSITDAGTGSATGGGVDYTFALQTLSFLTAEPYPNTKSISLTIIDDNPTVDPNETIELTLALTSGLTSLGITQHRIVLTESIEGLIVNEVSQGQTLLREFVELLVVGTPGGTVDLRGYHLDDNNGVFTDGASFTTGIASGFIQFEDVCTWEQVPVGALIVVYALDDGAFPADSNQALPAYDPSDENLDYVYVIPITSPNVSACNTPDVNELFRANNGLPNTANPAYGMANQDPCWSLISLRNDGDGMQIRDAMGNFLHGVSYGTGTNTPCAGGTGSFPCELRLDNHPDYLVYDSLSLYFTVGGGNTTYFFDNGFNDDPYLSRNWTSAAADANQSPGIGNSAANIAYINSLRQPFVPTINNSTYTCNLGPNQAKAYLNNNDEIILYIDNNSSTNHGATTADLTFGPVVQNLNLVNEPIFMAPDWTVTPSNIGTPSYTVRFYVSQATLDAYATQVNGILGSAYTGTSIAPLLVIYSRNFGNSPKTATNDLQVEIASTLIGSYPGGFTTYEASFNTFSTFSIGNTVNVLPIEGLSLQAQRKEQRIHLHWTTSSEENTDYFAIERQIDGGDFIELGRETAASNSQQIQQYDYIDPTVAGSELIYRLRMVDLDGSFRYSSQVKVLLEKPESFELLSLGPNPNQGHIQLSFRLPDPTTVKLHLYSLDGRLAYENQRSFSAGLQQWEHLIAHLPQGMYLYSLQSKGQTISGKLIHQ
ncbi:MAG: T9SS type A sorting domain-containing protein [Bacteroidota bacterium]